MHKCCCYAYAYVSSTRDIVVLTSDDAPGEMAWQDSGAAKAIKRRVCIPCLNSKVETGSSHTSGDSIGITKA